MGTTERKIHRHSKENINNSIYEVDSKITTTAEKPLPQNLSKIKSALINKKIPAKVVFVIIGILSTAWFLIRVIPKPSRATYPCMQATYPFMSGFVVYLIGLTATVFAFKKSKESFLNAKYLAAAAFLFVAVVAGIFSLTTESREVYANSQLLLGANQPVGQAKGIFPGRVVWVWDPASTNENITLKAYDPNNTKTGGPVFGDGWWLDKNTDMNVVNTMVTDAIKQLTGKTTISDAWDALFKYYNNNHGKGNVGYTEGEKIFIRTNQVSASGGTYETSTFEIKDQSRYGMAETSPQAVLALLRHLVNEVGVKQENISIGDPMKHMYKHMIDMWKSEFPNVVYIDTDARLGRTNPESNAQPSIYYSDRGSVLKTNGTSGNPVLSDYLPKVITEADYLIVVPSMKAHARGGITVNAKIHFGSNLRGSATHLHGGLVAPNKGTSTPLRTGYKHYRVLVDLMGHKDLNGKAVLFLVDALWGGSEANDPPRKFALPPFNNDWTSSIFVSQDQVALESVSFDFLKAEFTETNPYASWPQLVGTEDHILQAADSTFWPDNIKYDPENDGTTIGSLGVYESWNNPVDKKYSRNLNTGNGIELVFLDKTTSVNEQYENIPYSLVLNQNYPNPFNPSTTISFTIPQSGYTTLKVYDQLGSEVAVLFEQWGEAGRAYSILFDGSGLASGVYFTKLEFGKQQLTKKIMLLK